MSMHTLCIQPDVFPLGFLHCVHTVAGNGLIIYLLTSYLYSSPGVLSPTSILPEHVSTSFVDVLALDEMTPFLCR